MRRQRHGLAREVAEASRVEGAAARFVKSGNTDELVRVARQLERSQARAKRLRRDLKICEGDIKRAKREIKALAAQLQQGDGGEL